MSCFPDEPLRDDTQHEADRLYLAGSQKLSEQKLEELTSRLLRWHHRGMILRLLTLPWIIAAVFRRAPFLIYATQRAFDHRWRSARRPPEMSYMVLVHALIPGGGFTWGWYGDGRWWTQDYNEEKDDYTKREIRVTEWRELEGSATEPWHEHERYWPPTFDQKPKRPPELLEPRRRLRSNQNATERLFDRALEQGLFIKWARELVIDTSEIRTAIENYFSGIRVTIDRVESPSGEKYAVTLEDFPTRVDMWCGQEIPPPPHKQCIVVQINEDSIHAGGEMYGPAARGLAVGLNAHLIEVIEQKERDVAKLRTETSHQAKHQLPR